MSCARCGAVLAPDARVCGACQRLVHADQLGALARRARGEEDRSDLSAALGTWRDALDLLPEGTRQAQQIREHLQVLSGRLDGVSAPTASGDPSAPRAAVSPSVGARTRWGGLAATAAAA